MFLSAYCQAGIILVERAISYSHSLLLIEIVNLISDVEWFVVLNFGIIAL